MVFCPCILMISLALRAFSLELKGRTLTATCTLSDDAMVPEAFARIVGVLHPSMAVGRQASLTLAAMPATDNSAARYGPTRGPGEHPFGTTHSTNYVN